MWAYLLRTYGNKEAFDWHRMFCFATDRYHQEVFTVSLHYLLNMKKGLVRGHFLHKMVFLMNSLRERNSSYVWYNN